MRGPAGHLTCASSCSIHPSGQRYLREGLKRISRVIVFAFVMDAIYQYIVLRRFYPVEALVTVFVLAVLPYVLIRGPVHRIARRR